MTDLLPEPEDMAAARPLWLITLADLALLLVGFFVLLQASKPLDGKALAQGFRAGFGVAAPVEPTPPMPVAVARVDGFAPGSAALPDTAGVIDWARAVARDRRTQIRILGESAGRDDRDAATGSPAILAADRARAVAALLVRAGAVSPDQIILATTAGGSRRAVTLTLGFAGDRQ
jgi:flagellar motor protein MotB